MSGRSSNNGGGGVLGVQSIPAGSRKIVQNLKEIVNCPEPEIYAMLKECNMDPNEAVNRLLSQDPFHEVKSKREKKKENKDGTESRSRVVNNNTSRGGRSGADRNAGRGGSSQLTSTDSLQGKPAYKKENGANLYMGSASPASVAGNNNRRPPGQSDSVTTENKVSNLCSVEGISSISLPSPYQSAWLGVPGQVSMADIVKMGRTHGKASSTPKTSHQCVSNSHVQSPSSIALSESHASKVSQINPEPRITSDQHLSPCDEWPLIELPPVASGPSMFEPPAEAELHPDPSVLTFDIINQDPQTQTDEIKAEENRTIEDYSVNHIGSASLASGAMEEGAAGASLFDNDPYRNMGSYQPHNHAFQPQEVEDGGVLVSSVSADLQQLSIQREDRREAPVEDVPSVVIPNHLQLQTADCSHLSFGSFGSGISANFSGSFASTRPLKSNLEDPPADAGASSVGHSEARNPEYYVEETLRTASDGNLAHRTGESAENYDSPPVSQPEMLKDENSGGTHGDQYHFPSSAPGYSFENAQQLNTAFNDSHTSSQRQNLAPFSSVMAYTNSLPSTLLATTVHPGRDSDIPYSPFPMTQSMPANYGNTVSSISGSTISLPEALKTVSYSSAQLTAQSVPGTSIAAGLSLPQHIAMHPYSQPTLPLGPFTNMIGYQFLPQSYTYMPSAFQQAFGGNSIYHQSVAATLPQFKNSVSVSSLPQSAAVASGYGAFGSSTTIPGNFPMNPPTTIGYDDVLSSQYKDSSHLISLQQNENSATWLHGPGSRTMSAVPASTYYSFQGQNQQPGGFRQGQQPSQNYGALGYPNFYHSHSGISLEHQLQNPRDVSLIGTQGQPKQSQPTWQNGY